MGTELGVLDRIRANPAGRVALKIGVGVLGGLVIATGIVLIPFPGPGWAIVILGLGILAVEFTWAKRLLAFTRRQVAAWTAWIGRRPWPVRILLGLLCFALVVVIVWGTLRLSLGEDPLTWVREWLADQ